jgi:RNA polymerase sigma-70 factor (ECF subfamily)
MAAPLSVDRYETNTSTNTSTEIEDEVLVARLRLGDEAAFELLYERYFKRIASFVARRIDNRADVEETVQEVFFNVFSSIGGYRGEAPFGAWVFGLTRRTIASRFKRKRHPTVPLEENESSGPDPLQAYEASERADRLEAAVALQLTPEQRTLFELHHIQEKPIAEIALQLGKSEDAIKSKLYRTRKLLLAS